VAYEVLGILPWDFWRLTPAEFARLLKGARRQEERKWQRVGWAVAHLMNVSGKRLRSKVTPAKLLGKIVRSSRDRDRRTHGDDDS
jgi:hypothetical protein